MTFAGLRTRQARLLFWGLIIGTIVPGCAVKQEQAARSPLPSSTGSTSSGTTAPALVPAAEPEHQVRERERAISLLVEDAHLLLQQGKALYEAGQVEMGRLYFQEALDLIDVSGYSFEEFPVLEQTHHEIATEIRRVEVLASLAPEEPPFPLADGPGEAFSPLDVIAGLDLYTIEVDPHLEHLVSEDLKETPFDFPITVNQEVLKFLDYYQGRGRKAMTESLGRSGQYLPEIRRIFAQQGVPLDLIYMAHVESLFKPKAYSRARARGMWQFMAGTARLYGMQIDWWVDERLDFLRSTECAARHLKDLRNDFGDWYLALAAYNVGPGRVSRVLKRHGQMDYWTMVRKKLLPLDTRNYVPSILAAMIVYRKPERYGFQVEPDPPLRYDQVPVDFQIDLRVVAEQIGMDPTELKELNPHLIRGVTPSDGRGFSLRVPEGMGELAVNKLSAIPQEQRLKWAQHQVRKGETLSKIADSYGVSISAVAEVNNIRNVNRLALGQELMIPLSDWQPASGKSRENFETTVAGRHIVRSGDSLYKIARHYRLSLKDLYRWNNLRPGDIIRPGQEIRLGAGAASSGSGR